eukprot:tig00021348_g20597.t1
MSDITAILLAAQSPDATIRQNAEKQLKAAEESNFPGFLTTLTAELASEEKPADSRRLAGLIIKNALSAKDEQRRMQLFQAWVSLDAGIKAQIKGAMLTTLGSAVREARHTTAQVIAKIGAIELPRNEWPELVNLLLGNMTGTPSSALKQSTLEALGYVCEEIEANVLSQQSNQILTAVVQGMRKEETDEAVKLAATRALFNALEFVEQNFENEVERNYIMQVCCEATLATDPAVRVSAYECLVKIAALYYDKLAPYMQTLFNLTFKAIKSDDEAVGQQAVEFWSTVCDEEIDRNQEAEEAQENNEQPERVCQRFIQGATKYLVPLLLETLCRQEEDQDEDTWNVSMAAGTCLNLVANVVGDEVVQYVMPFVQQNINSKDWHAREASIMAFGSILEGPSKQSLMQLVREAVPIMLTHMTDESVLVRDTTAWTLGRICDFHCTSIPKENFAPMVHVFIKGLADEPRVAGNICWAVHNFAQAYEDADEQPSNDLSPFFQALMQQLLQTTEREDATECNLRSSAYEAINVLIQNCAQDVFPILTQIVPVIVERLERTFNMQIVSADDKEQQNELQALLCGVLQISTQKMGKNIYPLADKLMTLYLQVFSSKNATVHEESLMAVGALANAIEGEFERYLQHFAPFLNLGLRNWEESQVCAVAVGVVGDLCRALERKITPFCDEIVTVLLQNLQNPHLSRNVKPPIISCFGDIALAISGAFEKYFSTVMAMLGQAAATQINTDDYELAEYLNQLRESILEAYTGILQGLKTDKRAEVFLAYVDGVMDLLRRVYEDQNKSETVIRAAVGVIGDIASSCGPAVAGHMRQDFIKGIIKDAKKSDDSQTVETAKWAADQIKQLGG